MIVSASYRTDIPAFYARWFMTRFRAGWARVANPYGGPPSRVSLQDGVDGFVFWTRNILPLLEGLEDIRRAGLPFVVQYTVTGYPRALEGSVADPAHALAAMKTLAARFGPKVVVWRYDPVLLTSLTPVRWHEESFARLADGLAGVSDEVVMSFANPYRKTRRNLDAAAQAHGFTWNDPDPHAKREVLAGLGRLAVQRGLRATVCSQPDLLSDGLAAAACVDAQRLEAVAAGWGRERRIAARRKGNRPGCACDESRDLGAYDSCPHGCVYCYAVGARGTAKRRHAGHDPDGEFILSGTDGVDQGNHSSHMTRT